MRFNILLFVMVLLITGYIDIRADNVFFVNASNQDLTLHIVSTCPVITRHFPVGHIEAMPNDCSLRRIIVTTASRRDTILDVGSRDRTGTFVIRSIDNGNDLEIEGPLRWGTYGGTEGRIHVINATGINGVYYYVGYNVCRNDSGHFTFNGEVRTFKVGACYTVNVNGNIQGNETNKITGRNNSAAYVFRRRQGGGYEVVGLYN